MDETSIRLRKWVINDWWESRRLRYNGGLVIAGILAFVVYATLGPMWVGGEFEVTIFTIFFQGICYLFMMAVANGCYFLGAFVDKRMNLSDDEHFRKRLFNLGFWFSFALPFSIPGLLFIAYLFR